MIHSTTPSAFGIHPSSGGEFTHKGRGEFIGFWLTPSLLHCAVLNKKQEIIFTDTFAYTDLSELEEKLSPLKKHYPKAISGLALPNTDIFKRRLTIQKNLTEEEIEALVAFELSKILPYPLSEAYYDFAMIENVPSLRTHEITVDILALPKKSAEPYLTLLNALSLRLLTTQGTIEENYSRDISLASSPAMLVAKETSQYATF
jgi:hypothetical protein